jgi:DNA topoisomerase-6 subunit B
MRFANRVPLQYQQSACSTFKAVLDTTWKNYGVSQSRGAPPAGPMVVFVHMASVWVPFTSESKEAIADYDEIRKEITLALREAGRRLGVFLKRRARAHDEYKRRNVFELYIDEVVGACKRLKGGRFAEERLRKQLTDMAKKLTGGEKTDALVDEKSAPHGLPHSIIVTTEGVEGEVPSETPPAAVVAEAVHEAAAQDQQAEAKAAQAEEPKKGKAKAKPAKKAKAAKKSKPKAKASKKKGKR